jgi:hypothetical protein
VTIPACDYGAILTSEPDTWRERGLHFHCYSWRGDGQAMQANETARNDPASDVPPLAVRGWLTRPARLLRDAPLTPEDAEAWLRAEYEQIAPQLQGTTVGVEERMRIKLYDLRCGNDTVIAEWLRGGQMAYLVVLSVSPGECDRHGQPGA